MFIYQPGDVLVQYKGDPWPLLARIATGYPYPHAQLVAHVEVGHVGGQDVFIVEDHDDGIHTKPAYELDTFIIARPRTDAATKAAAIAYMQAHDGEPYAYLHLLEVALLGRTGLLRRPAGYDNDPIEDTRPKICSEAIARGYYHAGKVTGSGFDLVPQVSDYDTLPYHILAGGRCDMWLPDGTPFVFKP